eukprot:jgi/Chrzof1/3768/Cz13g08030.t1
MQTDSVYNPQSNYLSQLDCSAADVPTPRAPVVPIPTVVNNTDECSTVTITVFYQCDDTVIGANATANVTSGPNAGTYLFNVTDSSGASTLSYNSCLAGSDTISVCQEPTNACTEVEVLIDDGLPSPSVSPSVSPDVSPSVSPEVSPSVSPEVSPSVSPSVSPQVSP